MQNIENDCFLFQENILHRIHYHIANNHSEDTCSAPHCISHQKFAMTVADQVCNNITTVIIVC